MHIEGARKCSCGCEGFVRSFELSVDDLPSNKAPEIDPTLLKEALYGFQMLAANMENWSYVSTNAEYLDKKQVADSLEQILSQLKPLVLLLRDHIEIEALTRLDPFDLL